MSKILVLAIGIFLIFSMNSVIINGGESDFKEENIDNENDVVRQVTEIHDSITQASVQLPTEGTPTQLYLQVQDSTIAGYKNLSIEPFEASIQEASSPEIPAEGGSYKLGDDWITDVLSETRDLSGSWVFNIYGKISGTTGNGTLRAEVYSLVNGWLFSAPSTESIAGHNIYHNFTWTHDVEVGMIIPADDRIYVEFWLDATSGGTDSDQTINPDFDINSDGWTYYDWIDINYEFWQSTGGNPNGAIGVSYSRNDWLTIVLDYAGYWEQAFTPTSIPTSATLEFDWRCTDLYRMGFTFYVFIDSVPGNPNRNNAIWSQSVASESFWASVGPIDVSNIVDSTSTYYLKIAPVAITPGGGISIGTGMFDNVQVNWASPIPPVFSLGYDHISTPSSISAYIATDVIPPDHFNESPAIDGYSRILTPRISVNITDTFGINTSSIKYYINGFRVFHDLDSIPNGYKVSYWHESGFMPGEMVTCQIIAEDNNGNLLDFTWQFTILHSFEMQLHEGWNLISLPLIQPNESIDWGLQNISGKWMMMKWYDATDNNNPWKTHRPGASTNDLFSIDHTMGLWIYLTEPNVTFTVKGLIPTSSTIALYAGWNLVGYPTETNKTVSNALWGTGADRVEIFDAMNPYLISEVGPTHIMKPGEGYWVHVPADTIWFIDW